jgi:hypothetical protein
MLEGVYLDRTAAGLKPRFVKAEPPRDAEVADVVRKISRRVIRKLRRRGYLEAGMETAVATSVTQRIAFGERAGEKVQRIGSGFGSEGESPELKGPRCASGGNGEAPRACFRSGVPMGCATIPFGFPILLKSQAFQSV